MRAASLLLALVLCPVLVPFFTPGGPDRPPPARQKGERTEPKVILVIHGGAGVLTREEMKKARLKREDYETDLTLALKAGYKALRQGKAGIDAVEAAIRVMEDSELFNAGRGAALTSDGRAELDAALMEGKMDAPRGKNTKGKQDPRKRAGAVAGLTHVKNPISAARAVLEMKGQQHVLLVGEGAEAFLLRQDVQKTYRIERVSNAYFWTDRRLKQIREEIKREEQKGKGRGGEGQPKGKQGAGGCRADRYFGTVGAVALDNRNSLTAGTSTGGLANKLPGRIGDSPVIGAGTYADDRACGVSCTGTGELFIRHAVAHDVVARMLYGQKVSVRKAARDAIDQLPDEEGGIGGLIALDRQGQHAFAMSAKTEGMYRGYVTENGHIYVALYANEEPRLVK